MVSDFPSLLRLCVCLSFQQHATTKRWLHSHLHTSPLTHRQEVSGYGEDGGVGSDSGDNWRVECVGGAQLWGRDSQSHSFIHSLARHACMHAPPGEACSVMAHSLVVRGSPFFSSRVVPAHRHRQASVHSPQRCVRQQQLQRFVEHTDMHERCSMAACGSSFRA